MAIVSQMPDIFGDRQSGQVVRTQNVMAPQVVANIVKSSLGPVGLDKMLVDDIGDVTITNDGATILKMREVEHPAAKVLVQLSELQDREVGDDLCSFCCCRISQVQRSNDLVRKKIHPTSIISGYRLAMREACKYVDEKLAIKVCIRMDELLMHIFCICLHHKSAPGVPPGGPPGVSTRRLSSGPRPVHPNRLSVMESPPCGRLLRPGLDPLTS
ncbi:T-complex protein 1 subunit alpha [Platanthera guangdongensis]|uniref:T-complex protein 1 subunit alpha n=1 Tax=Platanthera guangdongensis TaxID=2320717 RepID=A0ABR2LUK7_9ASPA